MDVRRPRCLELGLFLIVVAVPLAFTPFSDSPFADPKILLLVTGALLVSLGGVPVDRRLAVAATAWVVVTAVACLAGVDPAAGLLASATGGGGGVVFTACCAVLLVCDPVAGREAQTLISHGIGNRLWEPDMRIAASRVDTLLNDLAGARAWLVQQLERFPGDQPLVSILANAPKA